MLYFGFGSICIIWGRSVSFSEAADHLATFTEINTPPQVFLYFPIKKWSQFTKHSTYILFCISKSFIIRVSGNEFFQCCSGHYSVKCHFWEKVTLLSYESKCYWQMGLHDIFECSFSLTT